MKENYQKIIPLNATSFLQFKSIRIHQLLEDFQQHQQQLQEQEQHIIIVFLLLIFCYNYIHAHNQY